MEMWDYVPMNKHNNMYQQRHSQQFYENQHQETSSSNQFKPMAMSEQRMEFYTNTIPWQHNQHPLIIHGQENPNSIGYITKPVDEIKTDLYYTNSYRKESSHNLESSVFISPKSDSYRSVTPRSDCSGRSEIYTTDGCDFSDYSSYGGWNKTDRTEQPLYESNNNNYLSSVESCSSSKSTNDSSPLRKSGRLPVSSKFYPDHTYVTSDYEAESKDNSSSSLYSDEEFSDYHETDTSNKEYNPNMARSFMKKSSRTSDQLKFRVENTRATRKSRVKRNSFEGNLPALLEISERKYVNASSKLDYVERLASGLLQLATTGIRDKNVVNNIMQIDFDALVYSSESDEDQ